MTVEEFFKQLVKNPVKKTKIMVYSYKVVSADLEISLIHSIKYEKYRENFHSHLILLLNMNKRHLFSCYKHN